jgi:hypothetical protein
MHAHRSPVTQYPCYVKCVCVQAVVVCSNSISLSASACNDDTLSSKGVVMLQAVQCGAAAYMWLCLAQPACNHTVQVLAIAVVSIDS